MSTEFQQYRDEYNRLRDSISSKIEVLDSLATDKQGSSCTEIEKAVRDMRSIVDQIHQGRIMWEGGEIAEAGRFITQCEVEILRIQTRFGEQRDRANLFARPAGSLEGGSSSERADLLAQRTGVARSAEYVQTICHMASETEQSGHGILETLAAHKTIELGLSEKMDVLSDDVAVGSKAFSRVEMREKFKTVVSGVALALAIVALSVFLYFVFKGA
jgi:predicted transcriptional regulator